MPGPYRIQLFFSDPLYGWSEDYLNGVVSYAAAEVALNALLRLAMLSPTVQCVYSRISDVTIHGDADVKVPDPGTNYGTYGGKTFAAGAAASDDALLVRLSDVTFTHFDHIFLRGVPSTIFFENSYIKQAAFVNAFQAWAAQLTAPGNNWLIFSQKNWAWTRPAVPIGLITPQSPRGFVIQGETAFPPVVGPPPPAVVPFGVGSAVRISRVARQMYGSNGIKIVSMVGPPALAPYLWSYTMGGATPAGTYSGGGMMQWVPSLLHGEGTYAITKVQIMRKTERKPGRPFGLSAGRRSTALPLRG
jgi:hypothetical protein